MDDADADDSTSTRSVIAAIIGNTIITLAKFAAFLISGSGAMRAEAFHSLADAINQVCLFIGIRRSAKKADRFFPLGYGKERYRWNLISAISVGFLAILTLYRGIETLLQPHTINVDVLVWVVLALAGVIDGATLWIAWQGIQKDKKATPVGMYLRDLTDPTGLGVLLEDSAAVLGILIAAAGIGLTIITHNPIWDGIASILIALLIVTVALFLIETNSRLIIGRAHEDTEKDIKELLKNHPAVERFHNLYTTIVGAEQIVVMAEIEFREETMLARMGKDRNGHIDTHTAELIVGIEHQLLTELEDAIRERCPEVTLIYIEPEYPLRPRYRRNEKGLLRT